MARPTWTLTGPLSAPHGAVLAGGVVLAVAPEDRAQTVTSQDGLTIGAAAVDGGKVDDRTIRIRVTNR
ncbi:MAG: hypothetical protein WAQ75_05345 [Propionicimonas sp.]